MKQRGKYPCFAAHWKLLRDTLFEADPSIQNYEFSTSIRVELYSEYVCVVFDREYLTEEHYIDTIEIEYDTFPFLGGIGWPDAWCHFMRHNITFVLSNSKEVSQIVLDGEDDYEYDRLKKLGVDVFIIPQIGMMLERKINKLCDFEI